MSGYVNKKFEVVGDLILSGASVRNWFEDRGTPPPIRTIITDSGTLTGIIRASCSGISFMYKLCKVRWGPCDETLVSIHDEGTFCVWDAATGDKRSNSPSVLPFSLSFLWEKYRSNSSFQTNGLVGALELSVSFFF